MKNLSKHKNKLLCLVCAFIVSLSGSLLAQTVRISGKVVEAFTDAPIIGASVLVKGTHSGTVTNVNGEFKLDVPSKATLSFGYIGYKTKEITLRPGQTLVNVALEEGAVALEEVVAIGYATQKKVSVTASMNSVKGDELLRAPVSSTANALAGRTPGLIAVQSSGEPGKDNANIYIRGVATFGGGGSAKPLIMVDGVERSFNEIDPNEIQSINILKDASATAVYGVRGANGVIIVTTKVGVAGRPKVSFSANYAIQSPTMLPDFLNAHQYATLHNEASFNDKTQEFFTDKDLTLYQNHTDPYFHPDVDHLSMLLNKAAPQQQYNVNVSGGSERSRYFISLGVFDQKGIFKFGDSFDGIDANPKYTRYNIRANVDTDWTKKFTTSIKIGTSLTNSNYAGGSGSPQFLNQIAAANPCSSPVYIDGKFVNGASDSPAKSVSNAPMYELLNNGVSYNFTSTLNIDIAATYKLDVITKGLSLKGKVSYDNYYLQKVNKQKSIPLYDLFRSSTDPQNPGYNSPAYVVSRYEGPVKFVSEDYSKNHKMYAEGALEYNRTFTGGHTVTGLMLGNIQRYYSGSNELPFNYIGLVGRVTYNYKNRYLAEVNLGINGSENFAKGNQYGVFPAYSVGWLFTEESFFPKNKVLTYGKIRGSYGKVGNDKSNYRFLFMPSSYTTVGNGYNDIRYFFGEQHQVALGYKEKSLGNELVTWETAVKMNIGLDLKFFNDRLQFTGDYFKEKRDDILWTLNIPVTFGKPSLVAPYNIGKAENQGYELELKYEDRVNSIGLGYWVSANYSFARNKIIYMDESPQPEPGLAGTGCRIGQPKGLIFDGFYNSWDEINDPDRPHSEWEGTTLAPGDVKYVDVNHDGTINANDKVSIGHPNVPEKIFALSLGANWKGFDFSLMFQGAGNVSVYTDGYGTIPFAGIWGNATTESLNRWEEKRYNAGEKITQPRVSLKSGGSYNNYQYSTLWQQDASYVRLKNAEIGYRISVAALEKVGIKSVRVYVNGQNLCTWTGMKNYDPERASGGGAFYPVMRVINMGASIQF